MLSDFLEIHIGTVLVCHFYLSNLVGDYIQGVQVFLKKMEEQI